MAADVVVVGGGHNGLVCAALLARAGRSVVLVERLDHVGGAAVSERPFKGVDARLSRYAYLVSLFPPRLAAELGIKLSLARREVSSCTPVGDRSLLLRSGGNDAELAAFTGDADAGEAWRRFYSGCERLAAAIFPTMLEPLRSPTALRARLADDELWDALTGRPLGDALAVNFPDDVVRGVVATDGLIGTSASLEDRSLAQNRCFLYHVVGGEWDVPVGGMGAVTSALEAAARAAGVTVLTGESVDAVDADVAGVSVRLTGGREVSARSLVWAAAPSLLDLMLGSGDEVPAADGCQLKVNMVLSRLPRLRDTSRDPRHAFAGTLHVHESATELDAAYHLAQRDEIPPLLPCELYCHTLADRTILGPSLRDTDAQTLTLFGLHTPAELFRTDRDGARAAAAAAALAALNDLLAEPIEDVLLRDGNGAPCIEVRTPLDLEQELGMVGGNIFHGDLQWPWAEDDAEVGRWGVETALPTVFLGGAGARRGGGVSGIAGHNAAKAVLALI